MLVIYNSIAFIFGATIGSFLNVVIYRMPIGESVTLPRSKCPGCKKIIPWYFNFPIVTYIFLRGKCRNCNYKIPIHYLFVELLTGFCALFLFDAFDLVSSLFYFNVACVFICIFIIDIKHKIIPDKINLYLLVLFLVYGILFKDPVHWILGGAVGFLGPFSITWLFYKLRNKVGLGGGDIKLFGILGLFLGPMGIMANIFFSSFLGSVIGIGLIISGKMQKGNSLAFGPYIIVIAFFQIFFPEYFRLVNPFSF